MSRTTDAPAINEMQQASLRRLAVANGARGVEALAGAGQTERANALADKIIQFDNSPETRGQLLQHASRAGNERVIAHINGK